MPKQVLCEHCLARIVDTLRDLSNSAEAAVNAQDDQRHAAWLHRLDADNEAAKVLLSEIDASGVVEGVGREHAR